MTIKRLNVSGESVHQSVVPAGGQNVVHRRFEAPGRSQGGREHVSKVFHTGPEQSCPEAEAAELARAPN